MLSQVYGNYEQIWIQINKKIKYFSKLSVLSLICESHNYFTINYLFTLNPLVRKSTISCVSMLMLLFFVMAKMISLYLISSVVHCPIPILFLSSLSYSKLSLFKLSPGSACYIYTVRMVTLLR